MSTHRFITRRCGKSGPAATAFFVLVLITLQLILVNSTTALAFSVPPATDPPRDSSFAGVSVVRVVSTYTLKPANTAIKPGEPTSIECTGLGVLVGSWTMLNSTEMNNWVLTDGNLVDGQESCAATHIQQLSLSNIELFLSSTYNSTPQFVPVEVSASTVRCQKTPCSDGPALLGFPTESIHTLPYVDLATTDLNAQAKIGLGQRNVTAGVPLPLPSPDSQNSQLSDGQYTDQVKQFISPQRIAITDTITRSEFGTPLVNAAGLLTAISLHSKMWTLADFSTWLHSQPELAEPQPVTHLNPVHDAWKNGIADYYQGNYTRANTEFQAAAKSNALFQAPLTFEQLIANRQTNVGNEGSTDKPITLSFFGISFTIPNLHALAILGFAVLGVLLVLVVALLIRSRTRRRRVFQEYNEAEQRAELEAQRIAAQEASQNAQRPPVLVPSQPLYGTDGAANPVALSDLRCPNCGQVVLKGDNFCSNCRMALSPSESGYHVRLTPQAPAQYSPVPVVPARTLSEQPTIEMSPGGSSEQPTLEIAPPIPVNGQSDVEKTLPYSLAMQQLKGNRIGFAVGTRSDPGIKRKYKPNEDSMFAAQWEGDGEALPFGLFVIADGMGGHANGQDASRSAIQTIIDFMLPKLSRSVDLQNQNLEQLLSSAVQHANQVVHQHNMEQRADMGTTVTAALIVGATAYVTNVGDSRTYLYREPDGLRKVTNDHSVVASLVEAGIIKPDDIYTHPKRNQIYRSLGEKSSVEVDSFVVQLQTGDKLLLCSDGLWDMVRDPKIEGVVKSTIPDPKMTANALIQAALDGGGEDNVSVIVISITETPQHNVGHGIQLLAKPDAVQMPQL